MILQPVVASFPTDLGRREGVRVGREIGARALAAAGRLAGARPGGFERDPAGAPLAAAGRHWSNANTRGLVVALVAPADAVRVGVDAEWLGRPRLAAARERLAPELARLGSDAPAAVLGLWAAKEAVLKLHGVGLADLARCTLAEAVPEGLVLLHRGARHLVRLLRHGAHVLAVACEGACEGAFGFEVHLRELAEGA